MWGLGGFLRGLLRSNKKPVNADIRVKYIYIYIIKKEKKDAANRALCYPRHASYRLYGRGDNYFGLGTKKKKKNMYINHTAKHISVSRIQYSYN